jgi:hypothetical protein
LTLSSFSLCALLAWWCALKGFDPRSVVAAMVSNRDVGWEHSEIDYPSRLSGPTEWLTVTGVGDYGKVILVRGLKDQNRFVACHVLLVELIQPMEAPPFWGYYGLDFDADEHGKVFIPEEQRERLFEWWSARIDEKQSRRDANGR